jgi:hypothetical protein
VYRIVDEKEKKTKEGMKIMGLGEGEYFLSYFIQYVVISIVVTFICALLLKVVLNRTPLYFLYVLLFLWALDVFALIYFFQSFIDSPNFLNKSIVAKITAVQGPPSNFETPPNALPKPPIAFVAAAPAFPLPNKPLPILPAFACIYLPIIP